MDALLGAFFARLPAGLGGGGADAFVKKSCRKNIWEKCKKLLTFLRVSVILAEQ
ncbi:MAG: hypothetical protein HFE84_06780 [Lachnospiraceae bacterium]|nr:hypothetical protein [Lachnospiraceae bacterium]